VHGGFTLGRSARRIRLLEIYVAIEGRVELSPCLFRNRSCSERPKHDCILGKKIMRLEEEFMQYLKITQLASVAAVSDLRKTA
jgi:DNA-binding IscR family transcriptional regulator